MPLTFLIEDRLRALDLTGSSLTTRAGISRPTLREIKRGRGTIRSLARLLPHLDLTWSWCLPSSPDPGLELALLRRRRALTQVDVARRIDVSRPVIIGIEKRMTGELASLRAYTELLGLGAPITLASRKRRLIPATNDPERDRVMTPTALAQAICEHFAPQMCGLVLDPARGEGAFHDHFPPHVERDWCEIDEGRDFMTWNRKADWIVTNPPWSRLADFLSQAMQLADNIVFVAALPNLTTKARLRMMQEAGFGLAELVQFDTPREWPQSGFQLVAAWIRRGHVGGCRFTRLQSRVTTADQSSTEVGADWQGNTG